MDQIAAAVARWMGVPLDAVRSRSRHRGVVWARELVIHLARERTILSYTEIAHWLGRPNHSTVITAHQRFKRRLRGGDWINGMTAPEALNQVRALVVTGPPKGRRPPAR